MIKAGRRPWFERMLAQIPQMLKYALSPSTGGGVFDRWKAIVGVAALAVLGALEYFGIYDSPNELYITIAGAVTAFVLFDAGHYDGKQGTGGSPP